MTQVTRRRKTQKKTILFFQSREEFAGCLFLIVVLILFTWMFFTIKRWMVSQEHVVISELIITGNRVFTGDDDIRQAILSLDDDNTFLSQDVDMVQKEILRIPWIKQVSVRKQWPNTIKLHLVEYQPVARWNDLHYLDPDGVVFSLPVGRINDEPFSYLYGPNGREKEVLSMYRQLTSMMMQNQQKELSITHLYVNERFSWEMVINNHYFLELGRTHIQTRMQRFLDIFQKIIAPISLEDGMINIDLRYRSGVAIDREKRD